MKQLPFELLHELGEWWKVDLFTGERVLATDSEVELWGALIELANVPREPVIIEQAPATSAGGPTMTKNEATRIMNGTAYIYDQMDIMSQIVNLKAFPGLKTALQQGALIYGFIAERWGIKQAPRKQAAPGEPTFADVINAEMKRQQYSPEPDAEPQPELTAEEIEAAEKLAIQEQTDKGGNYASW